MENETVDRVMKTVNLWQEGHEKIEDANRLMRKGPASYYFKKIEKYIEVLFDRFAPFQVGDRVVLSRTYGGDSIGWQHSRHFLIKGSKATVREVDIDSRSSKFICAIEFDNESWIDSEGIEHMTDPDKKHTFSFNEDWIVKL